MEINIDKSNWSKVNFGDVAIQMKGTVDRDNTDLKYYVKGEHMNSEDVHIRAFGELTDEYLGPAFIRHFKDGDILYGSRRTYLKKVAVAHFEGITSNTTFVINAKENVIDKRLLPFLMLSDGFTEHSIMHSKGSVNPYINWKDLANYEFLLPPKEQQAELANLLWAMDEVIEKDLEVLDRIHANNKVKIISFFKNLRNVESRRLGELVTIKSGDSPAKFQYTNSERGIPYLKVADLNESTIYQNFQKEWVLLTRNKPIPKGAVVFPKRGAAIMTNKVRILSNEAYLDTNLMALIIKDQDLLSSEFLHIFLEYEQLFKIADVAQIPQINNVHINPYIIKLPVIEEQNSFVNELSYISKSENVLESKLQASKALQKSLINQIF